MFKHPFGAISGIQEFSPHLLKFISMYFFLFVIAVVAEFLISSYWLL